MLKRKSVKNGCYLELSAFHIHTAAVRSILCELCRQGGHHRFYAQSITAASGRQASKFEEVVPSLVSRRSGAVETALGIHSFKGEGEQIPGIRGV